MASVAETKLLVYNEFFRLREGMNRLENMLMQMGPKENPKESQKGSEKESQKGSQKENTKEQKVEDLLFDGVEPLVGEMKIMYKEQKVVPV